jgi:ABC-type phosphate/phosphonate transport system substrate-binding protein
VWAATGIRGGYANAWHTVIRLGFDQTAENATGAGAPPASWPRLEQLVDVLHKTVFAVVTGVVADRLVPPALVSDRGRTSH